MPKDCQWYAVPDSGDSQESGDFHRLGQCDPRAHWLTSMKDAGNKGWTRHLSFIQSSSLPWRRRILHSWLIPYARIEKTTDKLCMGHQPVVEIIPTGETKSSFCQCQQRSGRSYSHCTEMQVSSLPPGPTSSRRWRMTGLQIQILHSQQEQEDGQFAPKKRTLVQVSHILAFIGFIWVDPGVRPIPTQVKNPKYSGKGGYTASSFNRLDVPP